MGPASWVDPGTLNSKTQGPLFWTLGGPKTRQKPPRRRPVAAALLRSGPSRRPPRRQPLSFTGFFAGFSGCLQGFTGL